MKNRIIEKTDDIVFSKGNLKMSDLGRMNTALNKVIDMENYQVQYKINIGYEMGDPLKTYTLHDAIRLVPEDRRKPGTQIEFMEDNDGTPSWIVYTYTGGNWEDENSWTSDSFDIIDGGEW